MNKMPLLVIGFILSACIPIPAIFPTSIPPVNLEATAPAATQNLIQSLPTPTLAPTNTPVLATASPTITPTLGSPVDTQNPILLTLTATLGTGTVAVSATPAPSTFIPVAGTSTPSSTLISGLIVTIVPDTPHPQFYGTLAPYLPSGKIILKNKSNSDVYISLQCTTSTGQVTILEYPVEGTEVAIVPAGRYFYVAWIGGEKVTGNFGLDKDEDKTLTIEKNKVTIK